MTLRVRVRRGDVFAMGPGKANLLEAVAATHSIAAAGRSLGYSYTKTRRLVDEMNASFREPLVVTTRGGHDRGGAAVTETGQAVLAIFRAMEAKAVAAAQEDYRRLCGLLEQTLRPGGAEPAPGP
jgi:molybdate transport system regulatory protein